jgi:hypothetical protein
LSVIFNTPRVIQLHLFGIFHTQWGIQLHWHLFVIVYTQCNTASLVCYFLCTQGNTASFVSYFSYTQGNTASLAFVCYCLYTQGNTASVFCYF